MAKAKKEEKTAKEEKNTKLEKAAKEQKDVKVEPAAKEEGAPSIITGETCPFCNAKTLSLTEAERDVPFFGQTYIFSMDCSSCHYHKADIESAEERPPCRYTIEIGSEADMNIRVIKSSFATVKIPHVGSIESGEGSNGYITNIEGILQRMKKVIEGLRDEAEEEDEKKKAKNLLKKLLRVMWGQEKIKMIIEDPTGNSAIISDKAVKENLKVKKVE